MGDHLIVNCLRIHFFPAFSFVHVQPEVLEQLTGLKELWMDGNKLTFLPGVSYTLMSLFSDCCSLTHHLEIISLDSPPPFQPHPTPPPPQTACLLKSSSKRAAVSLHQTFSSLKPAERAALWTRFSHWMNTHFLPTNKMHAFGFADVPGVIRTKHQLWKNYYIGGLIVRICLMRFFFHPNDQLVCKWVIIKALVLLPVFQQHQL